METFPPIIITIDSYSTCNEEGGAINMPLITSIIQNLNFEFVSNKLLSTRTVLKSKGLNKALVSGITSLTISTKSAQSL